MCRARENYSIKKHLQTCIYDCIMTINSDMTQYTINTVYVKMKGDSSDAEI